MEDLKNWLAKIGRINKMVVVVIKSDFTRGRTGRIMFGCERSGSYKPKSKATKEETTETLKKRMTGTKKCNCPFSIKATRHPVGEDNWVISEVICGIHNHPISPYIEGHAYHARLTTDEKGYFEDLSKGGVKPKVALALLKDRNPTNSSSLQTLYNVKKKLRKEEMDDKTEFQRLMMLADEAGYVISDRRYHENDIVKSFFFAHPDSISLAKCFPCVFLMDSTYKTNRHSWPLFEIVGITSTLKTFSVCYCFMEEEKLDDYKWALERFRELLFDDQTPLTFVTDRELALMNAIEIVFPKTTQILCRWHIAMGIEKKGKTELPKDGEDEGGELKEKWRKMWDCVVYANTMDEYESNLEALEQEWKAWPALFEYATSWLEYKEKFVSVWTNSVFHLGNTSTSRVEGAHASLKDSLLRTSRHSFLSMFQLIDKSLGLQMAEIKKSFTLSLNNIHHDHRISLFRDLRGCTSTECLKILKAVYDKWLAGYQDPEKCGCAKNATYGLPCACKLGKFVMENRPLQLADLHEFWRKLSVVPRRMEVDDLEQHEAYLAWVAKYKSASSDQKKYMLRRLRDDIGPQTTWLATPQQPAKPKGRPTKKKTKVETSTKRYPSDFEREVPLIPTAPSGQFYSLGSGTGSVKIGVPTKKKLPTKSDFEAYKEYLPSGYTAFVEDIQDVPGDGNCGFRAIAKAMGMCDKEGWKQVRADCILELFANKELYSRMFGGESEINALHQMFNHFESPTEGNRFWMLMPESGYILANFYRRVIVFLSSAHEMVLSFVPLNSRPPMTEPGKVAHIPVICIMHVAEKLHYVCVKLKQLSAPIPPPTSFYWKFRQPNAIG